MFSLFVLLKHAQPKCTMLKKEVRTWKVCHDGQRKVVLVQIWGKRVGGRIGPTTSTIAAIKLK